MAVACNSLSLLDPEPLPELEDEESLEDPESEPEPDEEPEDEPELESLDEAVAFFFEAMGQQLTV